MGFYEVAKLLRVKYHFKCEMCGKVKMGKLYKYKSLSLCRRYIAPLLEICEDCVYKESFGSKVWRKKKKERALDGDV